MGFSLTADAQLSGGPQTTVDSQTAALLYTFNGASWDRMRQTWDAPSSLITLSSQGAATLNSADQTNFGSKNLSLGINITVAGGTPTLVVTVQGKDIASGSYYNILTSAALATTGFTLMQIAVGLTAVANLTGSANIPRTWRVQAVVGGVSPAVTATIGASLT